MKVIKFLTAIFLLSNCSLNAQTSIKYSNWELIINNWNIINNKIEDSLFFRKEYEDDYDLNSNSMDLNSWQLKDSIGTVMYIIAEQDYSCKLSKVNLSLGSLNSSIDTLYNQNNLFVFDLKKDTSELNKCEVYIGLLPMNITGNRVYIYILNYNKKSPKLFYLNEALKIINSVDCQKKKD
jgi:hypothetical protein